MAMAQSSRNPFVNQVKSFQSLEIIRQTHTFVGRNPFVNQVKSFF